MNLAFNPVRAIVMTRVHEEHQDQLSHHQL